MSTIRIVRDTRKHKDGSYHLRLVVKRKNDRIVFDTGLTTTDENFNGEFNKNTPNYKAFNARLGGLKSSAEIVMLDNENTPLERLKRTLTSKIKGETISGNNFLHYFDEFVSLKTSEGTKRVYGNTRNKIALFDENCTLESMDRKWLTEFDNFCAKTMTVNARGIHLRNIRAVFNYCIDEEITSLYPFRKFKIKKEETKKRCLTVQQLRLLRNYPVEKHQEKYRDCFMLMFYLIGINAVDLFSLTDIVNGRIVYHRKKTNRLYSIKVEPEALEIINRYKGKKHLVSFAEDYNNYFDFLHRMGVELKRIGKMEREGQGGKKKITALFPHLSSYWSRHTWATLASELDIPKETISAALGHSQSSVTDIYIKFDEKKIDKANRSVIDFVNNKPKKRRNKIKSK